MSSKFTKWDVCDYLKTEEDYAHYLNAAIEEGDPDLLQMAIGDIARAKGMTSVAEDAGLGRESLGAEDYVCTSIRQFSGITPRPAALTPL